MKANWKVILTAVVATAVGFVMQSSGPVGSMIWPMPGDMPEPAGANLLLLIVMGAVEAIAFGAGVAFLVFGYSATRRLAGGPRWYGIAVFLSAAWILVNWVPHTALHMSHGNILTPADYTGLVGIEYGFHLTLIIAGAFLASFVLRMARGRAATAAEAPAPQATPATA